MVSSWLSLCYFERHGRKRRDAECTLHAPQRLTRRPELVCDSRLQSSDGPRCACESTCFVSWNSIATTPIHVVAGHSRLGARVPAKCHTPATLRKVRPDVEVGRCLQPSVTGAEELHWLRCWYNHTSNDNICHRRRATITIREKQSRYQVGITTAIPVRPQNGHHRQMRCER